MRAASRLGLGQVGSQLGIVGGRVFFVVSGARAIGHAVPNDLVVEAHGVPFVVEWGSTSCSHAQLVDEVLDHWDQGTVDMVGRGMDVTRRWTLCGHQALCPTSNGARIRRQSVCYPRDEWRRPAVSLDLCEDIHKVRGIGHPVVLH
jgi:hypothetical protein